MECVKARIYSYQHLLKFGFHPLSMTNIVENHNFSRTINHRVTFPVALRSAAAVIDLLASLTSLDFSDKEIMIRTWAHFTFIHLEQINHEKVDGKISQG